MLSGVLWFQLRYHGDFQVLFSRSTTTLDRYDSMASTLESQRKATVSLSLITLFHNNLSPDSVKPSSLVMFE